MRYQSYLNTAQKIITSYKGEVPFAIYLKQFFVADKKYGSKDRKQITSLCYNYYRLNKTVPMMTIEEKIILATFLCQQEPSAFLQFFNSAWNEQVTLPVQEKIDIANFPVEKLFPFSGELSKGIDIQQWQLAFLQQPDLFLRIRPGKNKIVQAKLNAAGFTFTLADENCITLPNTSKINDVITLDKEAVVQDLNSQKVLNGLKENLGDSDFIFDAWDCCAASGGKSILLYDILQGNAKLTVSDIRKSVLANLKKRFSVADIRKYELFIADMAVEHPSIAISTKDILICDVPCTGSGTWARTPEQLYYFDEAQIITYAHRQRRIAANCIPYLKKNGLFVYITCSVFAAENEAVIDYLKEKFHLQVLQMELLKGYDRKADTLFVAILKK